LPTNGEFFSMGGGQLFRGFDLAERQGSAVWVGSLEWRVPILKDLRWDCCDHVLGLRNIYGAAFYDVGDAYVSNRSVGPVAHAVGAGLRLDLAWFSFVERSVLRFDVAKTVNVDTPVQFWFGIMQPF
jgi:hemolysin activation/secretion protein